MNDSNQRKSKYLTGIRAFFIPVKSGKLQLRIWRTNLTNAGGEISEVYDKDTTHIIVGHGYSSLTINDQLKNNGIPDISSLGKSSPKVVSHFWLSTCFQRQRFEDEDCFYFLGDCRPKLVDDVLSEALIIRDKRTGTLLRYTGLE